MLSGASLAFFALIGFEDSVNVAEETKEPSRVFPPALFAGLGIALAVYMVVTLIAGMAVPTDTLAGVRRAAARGRAARAAGDEHEGLLGDRAVRAHERRADQHDHGVAADLRHVAAGDRAARDGPRPRRAPHAVGGDRLRRGARVRAAAARRPRVARRHDGAAPAVRLRLRERRRARAAARPRGPRALARADGAARDRRRRVPRPDRAEGDRGRGRVRLRRRAARPRRRAVADHAGADGAGRADRPRHARAISSRAAPRA